MWETDAQYFRVNYRKLDTRIKLSNGLRCDMKFQIDVDNNWVFALYPAFENLSEDTTVGDEWEALDEGTAVIRKPNDGESSNYFEMIKERVHLGSKAYFVGGAHRIAELEIVEIINELK